MNSALSEKGPDLGGNDFRLLQTRRIAVLGGDAASTYNLGAIWYLLDYELQTRYSIIHSSRINRVDLRKYNVLILPSASGGPGNYKRLFGKEGLSKLKDWVSDGGTLIGIGSGAAFLADSASRFSKVKLRRQALKELSLYRIAVEQERQIGEITIDSLAVWEGKKVVSGKESKKQPSANGKLKLLRMEDQRQRLFMPRGAILHVELDERHWLNFGVGDRVPAILYTSYAFLSKSPVQTAARFSSAERLRLSGLLWPEAKTRWEHTAYATREGRGRGQIILFAGEPNFRSYFYGTGRMLINSFLLGPGFGTRPVVEW